MKIDAIIEMMNNDRGIKTVTLYKSVKEVVRITRRGKSNSPTLLITMGKPNYEARAFIKLYKQAKEPLPTKRPQIKRYPIKRRKTKTV